MLKSFESERKKNPLKSIAGMLWRMEEGAPCHVKKEGLQEDHIGDLTCAPWGLGSIGLIRKAVNQNSQKGRKEQRGQGKKVPCVL